VELRVYCVSCIEEHHHQWFPWNGADGGRLPLAHMVALLSADMADDDKGAFMRESLSMFAQAQADGDDDDVEDGDGDDDDDDAGEN
jgi:hypothetical protein